MREVEKKEQAEVTFLRQCSFAQLACKAQRPDFFVAAPWDIPLKEVFESLEWHAEARDLPDRATYYVEAWI